MARIKPFGMAYIGLIGNPTADLKNHSPNLSGGAGMGCIRHIFQNNKDWLHDHFSQKYGQ
jgi:hypothetical protein